MSSWKLGSVKPVDFLDQSLCEPVRFALSPLGMALSTQRLWKKMSPKELQLARMWFDEDGLAPTEVVELLHQDKSTLTRRVVLKVERGQEGRAKAFTEE